MVFTGNKYLKESALFWALGAYVKSVTYMYYEKVASMRIVDKTTQELIGEMIIYAEYRGLHI